GISSARLSASSLQPPWAAWALDLLDPRAGSLRTVLGRAWGPLGSGPGATPSGLLDALAWFALIFA
ncbi:hypothetical protein P7K49_006502, partial [Saguinus oedipus]